MSPDCVARPAPAYQPPHFDDGDPHLLPFADDDYPPPARSRPLGVWRFLSRVRFLPGAAAALARRKPSAMAECVKIDGSRSPP